MLRKMTKAEKKQSAQFRAYMKAQEAQAKADVTVVRPVIAKDSDYKLFGAKDVSKWENETYRRIGRAVTRLTKAAVRVLYPRYQVLCRQSRSGWVHVSIEIPEFKGTDWRETGSQQRRIVDRAKAMLEIIGIPYGEYLPDIGPGATNAPCLSVYINDSGISHY